MNQWESLRFVRIYPVEMKKSTMNVWGIFHKPMTWKRRINLNGFQWYTVKHCRLLCKWGCSGVQWHRDDNMSHDRIKVGNIIGIIRMKWIWKSI